MAPPYLDKQITNTESPQEWLVRLGIDVATFCGMWISKQHQFMPFGCINFWVRTPATLWLPTDPTHQPTEVLVIPKIQLSTMVGIQQAIH